jgi:hypothetical protein
MSAYFASFFFSRATCKRSSKRAKSGSPSITPCVCITFSSMTPREASTNSSTRSWRCAQKSGSLPVRIGLRCFTRKWQARGLPKRCLHGEKQPALHSTAPCGAAHRFSWAASLRGRELLEFRSLTSSAGGSSYLALRYLVERDTYVLDLLAVPRIRDL